MRTDEPWVRATMVGEGSEKVYRKIGIEIRSIAKRSLYTDLCTIYKISDNKIYHNVHYNLHLTKDPIYQLRECITKYNFNVDDEKVQILGYYLLNIDKYNVWTGILHAAYMKCMKRLGDDDEVVWNAIDWNILYSYCSRTREWPSPTKFDCPTPYLRDSIELDEYKKKLSVVIPTETLENLIARLSDNATERVLMIGNVSTKIKLVELTNTIRIVYHQICVEYPEFGLLFDRLVETEKLPVPDISIWGLNVLIGQTHNIINNNSLLGAISKVVQKCVVRRISDDWILLKETVEVMGSCLGTIALKLFLTIMTRYVTDLYMMDMVGSKIKISRKFVKLSQKYIDKHGVTKFIKYP